MKQVLAFTPGADHPSSRLRIAAYADHFARRGWRLRVHHFDPGLGKVSPRFGSWWKRAAHRLRRAWQGARAVAALKRLHPDEPIIISRELPVNRGAFLRAPNPLVLDIDDALYLGSGRDRLRELCVQAQVVVCGNPTLAEALSAFSRRCVVIPTVVDADRYRIRKDHRLTGPLRIGWLGSSMSIDETLRPLMTVLEQIRGRLPFELVVISDEPPDFFSNFGWSHFVKWSPAIEAAIAEHMDVGLMPLQDNPYQAAKCGAKLVQYMAAGLPVIATPLGVNRDLVTDGVTGFWAAGPDDWQRALQQLADPEIRAAFGRAGRERVLRDFSIAGWTESWVEVLNELVLATDEHR